MNVQPHNFRKPGRMASDLELRLAVWLKNVCELAPNQWTKHLPYRVEMRYEGLDTIKAAEALSSLPDATVGYRVRLNDGEMQTLLVLPRPFALILVAGSLGDSLDEAPADRLLTAVEDSLTDYLIQNLILSLLQDAWPGPDAPRIQLEKREPNPKWTRLFAPDAGMVVGTLGVSGPFGDQAWQWLLPQKGLLKLLGVGPPPVDPELEKRTRAQLEDLVRELAVDLSVVIGSAQLPLAQVAALQTGDLLFLDQRISEPLTARVAGQDKFQVVPGRVGARQACQIISLTDE